jgi:hypothetical protein
MFIILGDFHHFPTKIVIESQCYENFLHKTAVIKVKMPIFFGEFF